MKLKAGHVLVKNKDKHIVKSKEDGEFLFDAGMVSYIYTEVDEKSEKVVGVSVPYEQYELAHKLLVWKEERDAKAREKRGRKF